MGLDDSHDPKGSDFHNSRKDDVLSRKRGKRDKKHLVSEKEKRILVSPLVKTFFVSYTKEQTQKVILTSPKLCIFAHFLEFH